MLVGVFDAFQPMFVILSVTVVTSVNAILLAKSAYGAQHGLFLFSYDYARRVRMYTSMHAYIDAYIHAYIQVHRYIHTYMHTYIYVRVAIHTRCSTPSEILKPSHSPRQQVPESQSYEAFPRATQRRQPQCSPEGPMCVCTHALHHAFTHALHHTYIHIHIHMFIPTATRRESGGTQEQAPKTCSPPAAPTILQTCV